MNMYAALSLAVWIPFLVILFIIMCDGVSTLATLLFETAKIFEKVAAASFVFGLLSFLILTIIFIAIHETPAATQNNTGYVDKAFSNGFHIQLESR